MTRSGRISASCLKRCSFLVIWRSNFTLLILHFWFLSDYHFCRLFLPNNVGDLHFLYKCKFEDFRCHSVRSPGVFQPVVNIYSVFSFPFSVFRSESFESFFVLIPIRGTHAVANRQLSSLLTCMYGFLCKLLCCARCFFFLIDVVIWTSHTFCRCEWLTFSHLRTNYGSNCITYLFLLIFRVLLLAFLLFALDFWTITFKYSY
jgi:hypothetical protein